MVIEPVRLQYLLTKYADNSCTRQEFEELYKYFGTVGENDMRLLMDNEYSKIDLDKRVVEVDWDEVYNKISASKFNTPVHRVHFLRTAWFRYAAAVIILLGIGTYFWNQKLSSPVAPAETSAKGGMDVAPGGNKAELILADGTKIVLDSASNGVIASQGSSKIVKTSAGILAYQVTPSPSTAESLQGVGGQAGKNTMRTPRGGQYQLTLPDGTKVWLNAESSITYPPSFASNKRSIHYWRSLF